MNDQAQKLRMLVQDRQGNHAKTLAVVSGKGGVGKSNISINTAMILNKKGYKILLFDLDIGMGNVNIMLGYSSPKTIADFLKRDIPITDIVYTTGEGISYISAGNGLNETLELNEMMLSKLLNGLSDLQQDYDFIIFDMAAGATASTLKILLAVDEIFVISTPEPTSMTDAYSMMKFISLEGSSSVFYLICNRAESEKQGRETLNRLKQTAVKFLQKDVVLLGVLPEDQHVRKAVISQTAFSIKFPSSSITVKLERLIDQYLNKKQAVDHNPAHSFIGKLRSLFFQK
ncbi:MinD/ParA family protein [Bacillus niameyensis]|uniref:MinD/ParA family protein n=1 Tax=Bacillus niameyensis TaxID=1522308 RepID=UPI000781A48E|nr:MinD/ParA family protein [Bacillus niameyensis]